LIEKRQIGRQASPFITQIKMNQDKLSSATRELRIIPSHHATHDPDAQSLLDGLSDILLAAERGDFKAPLERNSIPGNYLFNEINLRVHDSLGVFCAHQCFYVQVVNEHQGISPFVMEKSSLPKALAAAFNTHASALHSLEVMPGDLANDRSYKVTLAGMRILARDYQIDWGMELPTA
jgi:hypothetical protein